MLYARHLRRQLDAAQLPRHVAVVMDGNRRWARQMGFDNPSVGHRHGAEHLEELLGWCAEVGITHVTAFVASTDNLRKRDAVEVAFLMRMVEEVVADRLARPSNPWQVHVAGRLAELPGSTRDALKRAIDAAQGPHAKYHLTIAIGYDGREEIVDAVRSLLDRQARAGATIDDVAMGLTVDDIAAHLHTVGQPDPDLIIRTSGEVRTSGFLLWQAAHAQLFFYDVYWPGFRKIDFLRALRSYAQRTHSR